MDDERADNVVGALVLALSDDIARAAQAQAPEPGPAAAAIALLGHEPGLSIERLRGAVALSHPGAVRLVDRLVADGLVVRAGSERDRRSVALHLTEAGERACGAILDARRGALARALAAITPEERAELERIARKMLRGVLRSEAHAYAVCRLCDPTRCPDCPVDAELAARGE
jgi:DNA-binding MarR family transcriptional regulator